LSLHVDDISREQFTSDLKTFLSHGPIRQRHLWERLFKSALYNWLTHLLIKRCLWSWNCQKLRLLSHASIVGMRYEALKFTWKRCRTYKWYWPDDLPVVQTGVSQQWWQRS